MANTGQAITLQVDTAGGVYDVLPARESDGAPNGASHSVFHEDGSLAGFVSADGHRFGGPGAWFASGTPMHDRFATMAGAADAVAYLDYRARGTRTNPDLTGMEVKGFANGPFAVYARLPGRPEYVTRNHNRESAERAARRLAGEGARVHVSLDTCG